MTWRIMTLSLASKAAPHRCSVRRKRESGQVGDVNNEYGCKMYRKCARDMLDGALAAERLHKMASSGQDTDMPNAGQLAPILICWCVEKYESTSAMI